MWSAVNSHPIQKGSRKILLPFGINLKTRSVPIQISLLRYSPERKTEPKAYKSDKSDKSVSSEQSASSVCR